MPQAYVFTRYGGPETEALAEVDRPAPGHGRRVVFPACFGSEVSGAVGDGHARIRTVVEVAA